MSDPTLQSLADQIDTLTTHLKLQAADIKRLDELTGTFNAQFSDLESGKFARGIDMTGDLQIDGHLRLKGDHLHVDAPGLFLHGTDLIMDGRSHQLDPSRFYRALVDLGNKLVINFNGDYTDGVVCQSGLVVNSQVTTQVVQADTISTRSISTADGTGVVCGSGLVVDTLASTQGNAGVVTLNAAQLLIHGSDLMLDGRSSQIDRERAFRALVDMGDQLVINFHGDYQKGVLVDSNLNVAGDLTVGANIHSGFIGLKDDSTGQETIQMFGTPGNIHAKTIFANLRPPGGDCAEQFDVAESSVVDPGTVMIIGADGALEPCWIAYDMRAAGVISGAGDLAPGMVLNEKAGANRAAIALVGTVYCKVDADSAPISAGDLLTTSSTPGHGMKLVDQERGFGAVIGKALKPLSRGRGLIPVLVAPR